MTGASRGLGAAMAMALADAGADVAVHASEQPPVKTENAIKEKGRQSRSFTANLARREQTASLVPAVISAFGRLDILVNNAGTIRRKPAAEHPDDCWDEVIEVNLSSVFRLSRAGGPICSNAAAAARSSMSRRCCRFRVASRFRATPRQKGESRN